ncbi:MAG: hypothetical protein HUU20_07515 [Pirellulales bacterium]|nr:hypothetical protein [Pirellulales bacterium]
MTKWMILLAAVLLGWGRMQAETVTVEKQQEAAWRREVLPLPHELSIKQMCRLKPAEVTIRGRAGAAGLEREAVDSLTQLYREKSGGPPTGSGFEIVIGVMDEQGRLEGADVPQANRLKDLPNRDQAYVIQPVGTNRLVVAALADRGLYYGTRTLAQWFESRLAKTAVEIPLASVVDWPDLEERGFWHMPVSLVPWLASMKMNRFYVYHTFEVDNAGIHPESAYYETEEAVRREWTPPYEKARRYAAEVVPGPTHMDFWEARCNGYREAFPHLIGKGEAAKNPFVFPKWPQRVPCASHPDMVKILTAVLTELAAQKASEVMVWMSEYPHARCECEACSKEGQFRAEARVTLEAWREAQKQYPNLKVSLFFGRGGFYPPPERSYPDQQIKDIVASLPPEVSFLASMGCDGLDGRLLADFAAKGKRIARCNIVGLSAIYVSEDIRSRMAGIVADQYIGAWQFTPGGHGDPASFRRKFNFRLCALAEYAWNASGRSAKDFAEAWACRQGYKDPAAFVEWIDAMNVPQAHRVVHCWSGDVWASWFSRLPEIAAKRKWDDSLFFPGEIEPGIRKAERAMVLAEGLGDRELTSATQVLLAYSRMEQAAYRYITGLSTASPQGNAEIEASFAGLRDALDAYVQARAAAAGATVGSAPAPTTAKYHAAELEAVLAKLGAAKVTPKKLGSKLE